MQQVQQFFCSSRTFSSYPTQSLLPPPQDVIVRLSNCLTKIWHNRFPSLTQIPLDNFIHFYLRVDNPTLWPQGVNPSIHQAEV